MRSTLACVVALLSILFSSSACKPPVRRQDNDNSTFPYATIGPDTPGDPATTGYFVNHFCLNVRNTTETIRFYSETFGMRHLFTQFVSPRLSISYLGHSHGGRNGSGYQTAAELNREKNNIEGQIEIIQFDAPGGYKLQPSTQMPNTFSHIGMIVPDIKATQSRLEALGVTILKRTGEPFPADGGLIKAFGFQNLSELDESEAEGILQILNIANAPLIYVTDPDGNVIEIQPQELPATA